MWLSSAGNDPVNLFPAETDAKVKKNIRVLKIYNFLRAQSKVGELTDRHLNQF